MAQRHNLSGRSEYAAMTMTQSKQTWRLPRVFTMSIALLFVLIPFQTAFSETPVKHDKKTLVLDIYITGDSSVTGDQQDNAHKIATFSQHLREALAAQTRVDVINDDAVNAQMAEVNAQTNLHTCNRCDLNFANEVGAGLILKPNVYRMSHLISALHIEIVDAETGALLFKKAYDFRGTTDNAWERAIRYAVRDLKDWQK